MAQIKRLIFGVKIQITFIFVLKLTGIHTRRIENFGSRSRIIIRLSYSLTQHIFQLCIQIFSKNFKSIITSPVSWNRVIRVPVTEYYKNQHQKWQNFHEKNLGRCPDLPTRYPDNKVERNILSLYSPNTCFAHLAFGLRHSILNGILEKISYKCSSDFAVIKNHRFSNCVLLCCATFMLLLCYF